MEYEEERRQEMREMREVAVAVIQREMRGLWARRRWSEELMEGSRVVMGELVEEAVLVGEVGKLMDDDEVQWRCCKELHEELRQIEEREQERQERQRVQRFRDRLMQLDRAERKQREAGRGRGGSRRR